MRWALPCDRTSAAFANIRRRRIALGFRTSPAPNGARPLTLLCRISRTRASLRSIFPHTSCANSASFQCSTTICVASWRSRPSTTISVIGLYASNFPNNTISVAVNRISRFGMLICAATVRWRCATLRISDKACMKTLTTSSNICPIYGDSAFVLSSSHSTARSKRSASGKRSGAGTDLKA